MRLIAALAAALILSGCGTTYVAKPYDRAAAGVRTMGLVDDAAPPKAVAYEVASVGKNFGLIGALVDAGIQASREKAVNDAIAGTGYDAEAKLEQRLITQLGQQGYNVTLLPAADRGKKREMLKTYPAPAQPVDAYLDVVVNGYGYVSSGAFQPFRPAADATVRLVSAKDTSKVWMENRILLNPVGPTKGMITLAPNPTYEFKNREALLAEPQRLAAGLEDALNQVADAAVQLLR